MEPVRLAAELDEFYKQVKSVILDKQHPVSGLLPASVAITSHGNYRDAWVRDNVYSILAVWGLSIAYRALDDDQGRGYELEHRTVKLMRGLLRSMMAQATKVETFKKTRNPNDALHAKYDTETGGIVVDDTAWGHLQIDATSVFLLLLAQMIASGLEIIWTQDEVAFIQNLTYYIERAYRTPDYGIWERGAKMNHGRVELNASSLGMAKAALEALSGFNLFGARGGQASVIHVSPDNIAQADITLKSMLPRESNTKETDAALLSVVGYPGYAVSNRKLAELTRSTIVEKLEGRYGLKRFLLDVHQTVLEDEHRLHYEEQELKQFENIESEWPLFFAYLYLDALMRRDTRSATDYRAKLEHVLVQRDGHWLLPELFYVPHENIEAERANPHSQLRLPNANVPLVWAQSLYLLGRMLERGVLVPHDIDPLGRRQPKVRQRPVVQLLFLAEDEELQSQLAERGILTATPSDIRPVDVYLPEHIANVHAQVGRHDGLGLTGRSARALKSLTTSRIYKLRGQTVVCLASFFLQEEFYLAYDLDFLVRRFESELAYLHRNWTGRGRPTVTVFLTKDLLEGAADGFYSFMHKVSTGTVNGVPVRIGRLSELLHTASFERIDNLFDFVAPTAPLQALTRKKARALGASGKQVQLASSDELRIDTTAEPSQLLGRLEHTDNVYEQVELLAGLVRLLPMDAPVNVRDRETSVQKLLEEVYEEAGRLRLWAVIRRAAGLLNKVDVDLNLAVGVILVRQKNIQVGRAYSDVSLITRPVTEHELLSKINTFCRDDIRDHVLTQELILYISLLIKSQPTLFSELLTIRVSHLILLLASEIAREHSLSPDAGYEMLMHFAPSQIQRLLETVIARYHEIQGLPQELEQLHAPPTSTPLEWTQDLGLEKLKTPEGGWLAWRQHHGVIDRRPHNFYANTYRLFRHAQGLIIGDKLERRNRMDSQVVLSDMTAGEKSFALWLEHLLNRVHSPEYRQLNIEALNVLASFFAQNPSLKLEDTLSLESILGHAVRLAYVTAHPEREPNYNDFKASAWEEYYSLSPAETSKLLVGALQQLLIQTSPENGSVQPR
jgi:phosphorylase kinase alpha/beta subunit